MSQNILMVAENDVCRELARELENMIRRGDSRLSGKISKVMKETKDKSEYPKLLLHTGRVISDINEIYLFLFSDPHQSKSRKGRDPYEGLSSNWNNVDGNFDMDEFIQDELEYDENGEVIRGVDYDDEKISYDKSKSRRFDDQDSEDDLPQRMDVNALTSQFNEKRGRIQASKFRNGKPVKRMGRRSERRSSPQERDSSIERPRPKKSKKRRESSEYEDSGSDYPDGGEDLENYLTGEARRN